jgi:2-polyprenyl-6-methoxyphenol hydroxylase-like FAD-dependent oxidoreductase
MHYGVTHDVSYSPLSLHNSTPDIAQDHCLASESWSLRGSRADVRGYAVTIANWPDIANGVIDAVPADTPIDRKPMWRDPQPMWVSPGGRVLQPGDAAYTFLPSSGIGGTQATEDVTSFAVCLDVAGGKEGVADATQIHNLLRFERVNACRYLAWITR